MNPIYHRKGVKLSILPGHTKNWLRKTMNNKKQNPNNIGTSLLKSAVAPCFSTISTQI